MWIEITLELVEGKVRVTALSSRMERPRQHLLESTPEELEGFTKKVGRAVRAGSALDASLV